MLTAARWVAIVVLALAAMLSLVQGGAIVLTRRTSRVAYGTRRIGPGVALAWLTTSLTAAVFAGTLVALGHVLGAGVVMGAAGIVGTALSADGLARGGAAGPAPAVLWWVEAGAGLAALVAAPAGYVVLVAAVVISAVGAMLYGPTVSTLVTRCARPQRRASYQAALSISQDVGTALGPISGLALLRVATAAGLWAVAGGASVIAGLLGRAAAARPTPAVGDLRLSVRR